MAILADLLSQFYRYGLDAFPIVEELKFSENEAKSNPKRKPKKRYKLVGVLRRTDLDRWVSDLSCLKREYPHIPRELVKGRLLNSEIIEVFRDIEKIPIFNEQAKLLTFWNENDLLHALSKNSKKKEETKSSTKKEEVPNFLENTEWMVSLLLQALPWPLYACNLEGKTLFFNGRFEKEVLEKRVLQSSIQKAEEYFLEMIRNLLASSVVEERFKTDKLYTFDNKLEYCIRILNIEAKKKIYGYFFIFQSKEDFALPFVKDFSASFSLDEFMSELEARILYEALGKHGENISHTAKSLGIKRSTLQNKVQRLEIDKRFGRSVKGPVKRHRRTAKQIQEDQLAQEKLETKKTSKSSLSLKQKQTSKLLQKEIPKKSTSKKENKLSKKQRKTNEKDLDLNDKYRYSKNKENEASL